jgi:peptide/nickel transport system substrate-binding protein
VPSAPIAPARKAWFVSTAFRRALSFAINRDDICRVVYHGHAMPAAGPVSSSNRMWFNGALKPDPHSPTRALELLAGDGFRKRGDTLFDRTGAVVEFSIVTNSGNRLHERMLAMIQQDLAAIGIRVHIVTLDFPSLIERITRSFDYEACLLPIIAGLDPSDQMNVWLSSGAQHEWYPEEPKPASAWEAEVDGLMRAQASEIDDKTRKAAWDRVQQIVHDRVPTIFLVNPDAMCAISPKLRNAAPALLWPQVFWNAEQIVVSP